LTCRVIGVASAEQPNGRRGHEFRTSARQNGTSFTEMVWAFDLGYPLRRERGEERGEVSNPDKQKSAVRCGNEFGASLLIPAELAETKTAAGRRRMWRTRQAQGSHRPSPAGGGILVAASGKEASCRSSAAVPGCGCGRRLAASSIAGRDARPTRRRDACGTHSTQDFAAPTALEAEAIFLIRVNSCQFVQFVSVFPIDLPGQRRSIGGTSQRATWP